MQRLSERIAPLSLPPPLRAGADGEPGAWRHLVLATLESIIAAPD